MAFGGPALHEWLRRRRMQYNTTMPLLMLTPAERFVFNSIVFLITAMIVIAAFLYLPEHIATISGRVAYYWHGTLVELTGVDLPAAVGGAARTGVPVHNIVDLGGKLHEQIAFTPGAMAGVEL